MRADEQAGTGAEVRVVAARRVVTMAGPDVEAVAFVAGRVVAAGSRAQVVASYPDAAVSDYENATVLPGFNDAHLHLTMMAAQLLGVDLSAEHTPDLAVVRQRISAAAATRPPGGWVRASRYDHTASTGGRILDRHDLDALAPGHPAVLTHVGAHWGVVSSAALELAGLDASTPDPPGGRYGRDAAGELTGYVEEQALFDFAYPSLSRRPELVPQPSDEEAVDTIRRAGELLLAAGVTSVGDAMVGPAELRRLQLARERGELPVRVNALVTAPHLDALARIGVRGGFGDEWLRIGGVKVFADGAVAGRSCAVAEPFEGSDDRGVLTTDLATLREIAGRAAAHGLPIAVHANGERAIEMVLDVLEQLAPGTPPLRHRIEHCSIVTPDLVRRIRALDLVTVPFAGYPLYHGDKLLEWYGEERVGRMFAHRWLLDSGTTVAASSDFPCGPYPPLLGIQSCVTRTSTSGRPVGLEQRISLREALALYATGSAAASGEGHLKGRLVPGHLADLAVLDGDLTAVEPERIGAVPVLATWVDGRLAWSADRA